MRIGIDGYNLAMPQGTGVATYGASLAAVLAQMGHRVEGVFGLDVGRRIETRELLFFDSFGHGHRLTEGQVARRAGLAMVLNQLRRRLRRVPITTNIDRRGFGYRLPAFDALWSSPLLFETAYARFDYLGRFITVTVPDPPDVMHWTYPLPLRMAGTRNVYTIHDLVPLKLPHTTLDDKSYYHRLVERCIRDGDHICTVSEASRADILSLFDVAPEKVTNTYQSSPIPAELTAGSEAEDLAIVRDMFGLEEKGFYLFFGALDPKKNIERIIDAYLTSQSRAQLLIVGARDWGMNAQGRAPKDDGKVYGRIVGDRIVRLEYLPRTTLFRLIRAARAVLFPSLYEGFGLPALEAIELGTPVVTSNLSSLPEVVGEAGLLVDPYKTHEIAAAIRALDSDPALRARLGAAGPTQAARFSDAAYRQRLGDLYRRMGLTDAEQARR
jgi:glycosyltransferase involved in cell wall biosynthesis